MTGGSIETKTGFRAKLAGLVRKAARLAFGFALFAVIGNAADLHAADAQTAPDLIGTWRGEFSTNLSGRVARGLLTLTIKKQDGGTFTGSKEVDGEENGANPPLPESSLISGSPERIIGVISPDGGNLQIAEVGNPRWYIARLVDPDTIELTYVENSATPIVYRMEIRRQR